MTKKRKGRAKSTALLIDGAYARIQGRELGGKVDFASLRTELEYLAGTEFTECWYFDSQRFDARGNSPLAAEYHGLKFARPFGPQFQVEVFSTKKYNCRCPKCGHHFTQNVQKGVDNAIATKLLTLTTQNYIDRVVLLSGDGDFYTSLGFVRNALRKEVWVVGFCRTVSGDLQQLSTRLIWINDLWGRVKYQARQESGVPRLDPANIYGRYLQIRSSRQPTHRSQRRRHSRASYEWRERYESDDERDTADLHGPSRRHCRVLSPQHQVSPSSTHRFEPPYRGDGAEFDEVNLSGSEDDGTLSRSPRSEENAGRTDSEGQAVAEPTSSARRSTQFPLPMAVPVAVAANGARPPPLFEWAFGESA